MTCPDLHGQRSPRRGAGRLRRSAWILAGAFATLYAVTWNGRYLHDGPTFLRAVDAGEWLHVHMAYLPLAQTLLAAFGWIPGVGGPQVLAAMAVGSGAVCVAFSTLLAGRLTADVSVAIVVGILIGLAPVVWSASGMVEIHVFGAAGACIAAWAAYALPGRAWHRAGLATAGSMAAHMTNVLLVPFFVVLALERPSPRGRSSTRVELPEQDLDGTSRFRGARSSREGLLAVASAATCVGLMHALGRHLPPQPEAMGGALPTLLRRSWALARQPLLMLQSLEVEFGRPWLLAALAPLLLLLPGGSISVLVRLTAAGTAAVGAVLAATYIRIAGQYGLVLCPVLALGLAHALAGTRRARAFAPSAVVALLLTGIAAPIEHANLSRDDDREWASAVSPYLTLDCTVLCLGWARKLRIEELTSAQAVDFQPAGDRGADRAEEMILSALHAARSEGRTLYLDARALDVGPLGAPLAPILRALVEVAELTPLAEGQLLRIEESGAPRETDF